MLSKPTSCTGCALHELGVGFMVPDLGSNGVLLLGEGLGSNEVDEGRPFVGKAGFKLTRLLEFAGFDRKDFSIANSIFCQPPSNKLEGTDYELSSTSHCRQAHWDHLIDSHRVLVPMGNVATNVLLGFKSILSRRGYIENGPRGTYVIPTIHPSFVQRGQSRWSAAFIADIQKAVEVATHGVPPQFTRYTLDPSPSEAYRWAKDYRQALDSNSSIRLAFDIETPGKGEDEDELDSSDDLPDQTWHIERIGFAYRPYEALSIPFDPIYIAAIRLIMGSNGEKVVWNASFDVPRLRRAGVGPNGLVHDAMVAWHILHTDLPKSLRFVATLTCPFQPAWKHLSGARPAFYNATDADVELRAMIEIERELRRVGLWSVYQSDVIDLQPVLDHMTSNGMPVDPDVRLDRVVRADTALKETKELMGSLVPIEARRIDHVYVNTPVDTTNLQSRPGSRNVSVCSVCDLPKPRKDHFKRFVKKLNLCAEGRAIRVDREVTEFYRLAPFTPSRDQLILYHRHLARPLPLVWDAKERKQKVSFAEGKLRELIIRYPTDRLYPTILEFRGIDKVCSTYLGRPESDIS